MLPERSFVAMVVVGPSTETAQVVALSIPLENPGVHVGG
jgi:hypothetical protein